MKKISQAGEREPARNKPRVGDMFDLVIVSLDEAGHGIGLAGDTPVLVSGALPGETVRARVTFSGRRECFAATVKVLRHSPARLMTPPCARGAVCEGCPLIVMKYPAQLDWKREMVENALRGYAALQGVTPDPVIPSPRPLNYCNSVRLAIGGKFDAPVISLYGHATRETTEISDCPLYHPLVMRVVRAAKEGIRKGKVPVFSERSGTGLLRYLAVRVAEAENLAMVVFVTSQRSFNEMHHLGKFIRGEVPEVEVVVQNVNSSRGKALFGEKDHYLTRKKSLVGTIGDIRYAISPRSSFPVNAGGSLVVYEKIREWAGLTGSETVIDLYCGNGGVSLYLARGAKAIVGIDAVEGAVVEAESNALLNGIRNCRFEAGETAELLAEILEEGIRPRVIFINAPAKGCGKDALHRAALLAPERIIHRSGNIRSLTHDLDILVHCGYRPVKVQPVDLFPQTPRVDTVTLLVKF